MVKSFLTVLALVMTYQVNAATVQLSSGWQSTVSDFNCQTVISAFVTVLGASSGDCGFQSVSTGTNLTFRNASGAAVANPTVSAVTGWVAPSGGSTLQTQVNTIQTNLSSVTGRVAALENDVSALKGSGASGLQLESRDDADAILTAFVVLLGIAGTYKIIRSALNTSDLSSDERH